MSNAKLPKSGNSDKAQEQLAVAIAKRATPSENTALRHWIVELLEIRGADISALRKSRRALAATAASKVIWPILKIAARQIKQYGWDQRSTTQRLGISGVAVGLTFFGGQSAGIAALGGAVGVPLWVVLGAGSMFAHRLYKELLGAETKSDITYTVLDGKKKDD